MKKTSKATLAEKPSLATANSTTSSVIAKQIKGKSTPAVPQ
nr:hypothetical protein [Stanieria cyanosphaera]